ncbi:hypothetical protein [Ramlibacter humi]|nr:hypothetical protein [Ramlibacter humi]
MGIENPTGIPRLDREEPDLWMEEDIPTPSSDDPEEIAENTDVQRQTP